MSDNEIGIQRTDTATKEPREEARNEEDVVTIGLNPHVSYEAYAHLRSRGAVQRVSFTAEEGTRAPEIQEFLGRDHFFLTRYAEVAAVLLDSRFSVDPRSVMTPEQHKKLPQMPEELQ